MRARLLPGLCALSAAILCVVVTGLIWSRWGAASAVRAEHIEAVPFTAEYYTTINERFGVGVTSAITVSENGAVRSALITDYDVNSLYVGWYSDWHTQYDPLRPGGMKYAQLILVRATRYPTNTLSLTETVQANAPGALWIIGNEPEGQYNQGDRQPGEYAEIYHDVYTLIKGIDPGAWIAIGAVIEPTPLRLQWLEEVLGEYQARYGQPMPVDVWNIHVQILREKGPFEGCPDCWGAAVPKGVDATEGRLYGLADNADPAIFGQLVTEFRQWMKAKGFQNKPLIISEYGVLLPWYHLADDEATGDWMVTNFMRQTFGFLIHAKDPDLGYPADDNRLVQQWLWYSLNDQPYDDMTGVGFNGSLFDYRDPTKMTKFGRAFRDYMRVLLGYPRTMLPWVGWRQPTN